MATDVFEKYYATENNVRNKEERDRMLCNSNLPTCIEQWSISFENEEKSGSQRDAALQKEAQKTEHVSEMKIQR